MSRALTARTIETLKPGPNRQEIPDPLLPGHYPIFQPSGAGSFAVRYRLGGRSRKYTVGPYPAIDLKTARALATQALRAVAEGRDPGREKAALRSERLDTVEAVAKQFVELHCRRANRPRTIEGTQQLLDLHVLPRWRRRLITDITRPHLLDLLAPPLPDPRPP